MFTTDCAVCHGDKRQGVTGLGPALTPISLASQTETQLKDTITNGRPNTAMAGFSTRLTLDQITALAQFIKNVAP